MYQKKIKVKLIAQTQINREEMVEWIRELGFKEYELPPVDEEKGITPSAILIMAAAKRCYNAFDLGVNPNLKKVRTDLASYLENIFASGHGSVVEHATYSFSIEGATRVFTAEMNRHRAGTAISEGSLRYIRFDNIGYWEPHSIQEQDQILANLEKHFGVDGLKERKMLTRTIFKTIFREVEQAYIHLCGLWEIDKLESFKEKKLLTSMFRRIVPMGCSTGGVWTLNVRALRHVLTMRGSEHAEEEIFEVADQIANIMVRKEPFLFGDFKKENGAWKPKFMKI
jgi:thymidylate synthase (FAD)